jgi:hypothetical protein
MDFIEVSKAIDAVFFDSVNGVPGTSFPIGTAEAPVNNIGDALKIAAARKSKTIKLVYGVITLYADISDINFIGNYYNDPGYLFTNNTIELNGFKASGCTFRGVNIDNNSLGVPDAGNLYRCGYFIDCDIIYADTIDHCISFYNCSDIECSNNLTYCYNFYNISYISAITMSFCANFINCKSVSVINMTNSGQFYDCDYMSATNTTDNKGFFNCSMGTSNTLNNPTAGLFNFHGSIITITNLTNTITCWGDFTLILDGTCAAGTVNVYGNVKLINNAAAGCTVNDYTNKPNKEVPVNTTAPNGSENNFLDLETANFHYTIDDLILKCATPGADTIVITLYKEVNGGWPVAVHTFSVTAAGALVRGVSSGYANYLGLDDMFTRTQLAGDKIKITVKTTGAGGGYAVTGSYCYRSA